MQQIFEQILNTNLINFLIVISTLVLIFKKAHLGDLIDKMALDVKNSVEKSASDTQNAIKEYKETKRAVKDTPKIRAQIIENAKINAQNMKENLERITQKQTNILLENLEKIKSAQGNKIKDATTNALYQSCVDLAFDEAKNLLSFDMHRKLINSSIDELDKIDGSLL